jgi:hypothetical protein
MQHGFIPARVITLQTGMPESLLFSYYVKLSHLIRIEAVCEYRAFSKEQRGK